MRSVIRSGPVSLHPNFALNRDLRQSGQLDPALRHHAGMLALRARELAVRQAFDQGDYFSSIHAEVGDKPAAARGRAGRGATSSLGGGGLRVGRVVAGDFKAHWVEYGWRHTSHGRPTGKHIPGKRILRKAVRGSGLRYRAPKGRS